MINVQWMPSEHSGILWSFNDCWDADMFQNALLQHWLLLEAVDDTVKIIFDFSESTTPLQTIEAMSDAFVQLFISTTHGIIVGDKDTFYAIYTHVTQWITDINYAYDFVDTVEDVMMPVDRSVAYI